MGNLKVTGFASSPEFSLSELSAQSPPLVAPRRSSLRNACHSAIILASLTTSILIIPTVPCGELNAQSLALSRSEFGSEDANWATGKALTKALCGPTSVSWTDAPFADRVRAFAADKRIAIFVDRRLDPGVKLNLQRTNVTVQQLFIDVADQAGVGMCRLDDLIYFGPLTTAQALPIAWHELPRLTQQPASQISWHALSKPDEILEQSVESSGIKVTNSERIHHDLWAATDLPKLTPTQQVALIGVGFGVWPVLDEHRTNGLKFENWNPPSHGTVQFPRLAGDPVNASRLKTVLRKKFRGVKFSVSKKSVTMTGSPEQLYSATAFLIRRNKLSPPSSNDIRFTLKTSATRKQLLKTIADQTGRKLFHASSINEELDQQIEIECRQIDLESLIATTLEGSELDFGLTESEIRIFKNSE